MSRFCITGVINTGIHTAIVVFLVELLLVFPPIANGAGFTVATLFSYLVNSVWSFRVPMTGTTFYRFWIVCLIGLCITITVAWIVDSLGIYYLLGVLIVVSVTIPITFSLHWLWTFRAIQK